ncbi:MAG: adenosylmethionine---8-amino-7-oxononanoate aminotransferase [Methanothermococcus sp.]|jgi:adenosylmethionine-8-amino-7-oxononanoate aminotransferase|uniref:adenosylmethionine--8-amino-7-oxononanoate transaminase n=1 Tax=Methanothermococcus TaxID=155862 RepID=UPI000380B2BB|nr:MULTISPECIES: adenosylmethionine--8-amino-7-oxononanoate transaminase [Methanothermococcus]MDK2791029.1 adenosylmethionine---8-amino-7-oxononanoate aminotransferase [Methanothermococcus sp.]
MKIDPNLIDRWDKEYIWHPYTQMKEYENSKNLIIEKGEGNYLIDIHGKKYLDAVSSIWCNMFGHGEKRIIDAIKNQTEKICHSTLLGCGNVPSAVLAKKLVDITPEHLKKVFYSEDGAEAVEIAVKMAFEYYLLKEGKSSKRNKFISVKEGYHGDTIGAMSVGGSETFHGYFKPLLFKGYYAETPYCYRCKHHNFKDTDERNEKGCDMKCLENMKDLIEKHKDEVFCVIFEGGMMGSAGMIPYPEGYIEEVAKTCKEHDIIFILDEVATFGRTGKLLYSDNEELKKLEKPDIICLGKGITGGYLPLAVTMTTEEIYNAFLGDFEECKQFFHGHTYTGNQILCSAGIATLDIIEQDKIFEKIQPKIKLFHEELEKLKELENVGDIRKKGFMVGIELVKDKKTKEPYPYEYKAGYKVAEILLQKGIYMRPIFNTIILVPPLSITEDEIKFLCEKLYESIEEFSKL